MLIAALLFLVFIIIIAKSRTIWLLSGLFIPAGIFMQYRAATRSGRQAIAAIVILVMLLPACFLATRMAFFQKRLMRENAVIASIIDSDDREVAPTSVGRRYYMTRVFLEEAGARPVFGWGPGLSRQLLEQSSLPDMQKVQHFHNIYIEILLQLGLVGFGLFAAMFAVLIRAVFTVRPAGADARKLRWLLCCSLLAFGLTGLLNNPLWSNATPYFFALLGGIAYTPRAHAYLRAVPLATLPPAAIQDDQS
jgi:O-antigen ligase